MDIQGLHNSTNVTDLEQGLDFGHGNFQILLRKPVPGALDDFYLIQKWMIF